MSDEFTEQILKIIIAQTAQKCGFSTISETALDILVEAVIANIREVCTNSTRVTNHCGRIDTNGYDLFFALNNLPNRESVSTLTVFLSQADKLITPFEFFVDNYPAFEKNINPFYEQQLKPQEQRPMNSEPKLWEKPMPFRIYNPPEMKQSQGKQSHIPAFYPNFPNTYTYQYTATPLPESAPDNTDAEARRSRDQNNLQKEIEEMGKSQDNKSQQSVEFDSQLTQLLSNEMVRRPTALLESPIYALDGIRSEVNPEFLPLEFVKLDNNRTRDDGTSLRILNIKHLDLYCGKPGDLHSSEKDKGDNKEAKQE
ncbi:hypothetical protein TVAG_311560 [Trichomonas vaginalis G3]|uniref:Transcription initiation factor TFIID subunit 8 n=1 Tax=Trichomonas vaginalis (strain ATCC PRA-98 / G3) TaxID=412133 RepID=A2EJW3_TRIV3|nr:transcription initiation factor TFIID subunit 8 family [Trichomonas vaginalis G3]EAY07031.1 hypothetical protein TVAG_311560 [Trichomonas vaginalis G3]KAI5529573.1 transcription initiation factor TFIID subunit 8 family [Trichomonas vaginalis G3]|eukprot:XP_001319254.1 hypothetical protein [Trichomonas vaginalis G3]